MLLKKAWYNKYWILASILLFLAGAYYYLRYSTSVYSASAKIVVRDEKSGGVMSEEQIFQDLGIYTGNKNVLNEIAVLRSSSLMETVVRELQLHERVIGQGNIRNTEYYGDLPIFVDSGDLLGTYEVEIVDDEVFYLKEVEGEEKKQLKFDSLYRLDNGSLRISLNPFTSYKNDMPLLLDLNTIEGMARKLSNKLEVKKESDYASIINISIEATNPEKAANILNTLIEKYSDLTLEEKNEGYKRTLEFIEERIILLTRELGFVEGEIEQFKERNRIAGDATEAVDDLSSQLAEYERRMSELEISRDILQSLEEQLEDPERTFQLLPSSMAPENQGINELVGNFNQLVLERRQLLSTAGEANPMVNRLEARIIELKSNVLNSIDRALRDNQLSMQGVEQKIDQIMAQFRAVPRKERELLEIVRQQRIKENLYLYLLEKREEIGLSMNMASSNVSVIDEARPAKSPVSPKPKQVYAISLSLGLTLPLAIIFLIQLLDNKIRNREDIKQRLDLPIVGEILENSKEKKKLIAEGSAQSSEMFRLLRTNVNFLISGQDHPNILVTSFESGEGKTYVACNLALSFAITGKKVALLGLDLRKPKLHDYFDYSPSDAGITNYIMKEAELGDIRRPSGQNENLDIFLSGVIPPNPAELLLRTRFTELISELRDQYDIIIWDTAPVGLVSDTLSIKDLATCSLFVVKQGFSHHKALDVLKEEEEKNQLPNPAVVLNGIKEGSFYGYGRYRYGYGRYNKGYYS